MITGLSLRIRREGVEVFSGGSIVLALADPFVVVEGADDFVVGGDDLLEEEEIVLVSLSCSLLLSQVVVLNSTTSRLNLTTLASHSARLGTHLNLKP